MAPAVFPGYGNPCRSQSPSTNTRRSDILLREGKEKREEKPRMYNSLKSDDKYSLLLRTTQPLAWMTGRAAPRRSNWRMKFPSPNLQERHGSSDAVLLADIRFEPGETLRGWRGAVGCFQPQKKKNEIFIPFFSPPPSSSLSPPPPPPPMMMMMM